MTPENTPRIGFIGYGAMASRMGDHLRAAGYTISAYTPSGRSPDPTVSMLATPRALAQQADAILVCVPDDEALAASMYGDNGALAGMKPGTMLLNTSSVSPEASTELFASGRKAGVIVLDSPVSGSTPEAETANLVILVGGDPENVAEAAPIFDAIGKLTLHAGPPGSGTRLKLVINGIMGAGLTTLAEAVGYGLASGLDRSTLFDALDQVAVISPHHKRKLRAAKEGDFASQFPARLMQKDMRLLLDAAAREVVPVPTLAAATQQLSLARRLSPNEDYSSLIRVMEKIVANDD
ncbi:NAD(P)-dependent oxidoreductase [Acetobacter conturbans]|uniref:NAD(P)-dependent oxidoreductase n=1 Tax=Acetobacter conturbans TaxID=1737472 RepID=UPI001568FA23|nr:NAD(P)-dependent oxidoreductase [Acetobacter conturbans]